MKRNAEQLAKHRARQAIYRARNRELLNEKQKIYFSRPDVKAHRRVTYRANTIRNLLAEARKRARARGLEYNLRAESLALPTVCPVLGIPIIVGGPRDNWPSIDRINNALGYVVENVCIVSNRANALKRDASIEEVQKIIEYMRSKS